MTENMTEFEKSICIVDLMCRTAKRLDTVVYYVPHTKEITLDYRAMLRFERKQKEQRRHKS